MLKKPYRLKKTGAFNATYKVRHSYCKNGIVLWVGKKKTDEKFPTKIGFVVSKKTHKRAVRRNRLKRLMRESYRIILKNGEDNAANSFMSLIFVGMSKALDKNFSQIDKTMKELINGIRA